jgi:GT2 family glycosyltransferase
VQPLISIVIPNMNGMEHLPECFASLQAAAYPPDRQEWILSDNGSVDGSLAFIREQYPRTRIVENGRNIGFAAGCNAGAAAATGTYLVFLNNDTRVHPDWLTGYLRALARDPAAVCAASYMRSWDDTEADFDGASANLFGVGRQQAVTGWPDSPAGPGEGDPLLFACGGAMLIRRDVFHEAGGFDPSFFIYFEDVDLGWRLWTMGHRVVFAPGSRVYHKEGGTTGAKRAASHRRYLLFETNTLAAVVKNYEDANLARILPAALLLEWKRALLAAGAAIDPAHYRLGGTRRDPAIEERGEAALPPMSVAHLLAFGRLAERWPALWAERARIQARRRRADRDILPLFGRPFQPQFAGAGYADAVRRIAAALDLYEIVADAAPSRILLLRRDADARAGALRATLGEFLVAERAPDAPDAASLAATADLLIARGDALPAAAGLAPDTPLAADVGAWTAASAPAGTRDLLARRAGLLIVAEPGAVAGWQAALPRLLVVAQAPGAPLDARLRHYCRYPLRDPAGSGAE